MNNDHTTFTNVANQLERTIALPDVSLVVTEAERRARVHAIVFRGVLGLSAVIIVTLVWSTAFRPSDGRASETVTASPSLNDVVDQGVPTTTAEPGPVSTTTQVQVQPAGLTADLDSSQPGVRIRVSSERNTLGGWFSFERRDGDQWLPVVTALQAQEVNGTASFVPLGQDLDIDDLGLESPVTLEIPAGTEPGLYRICEYSTNRCTTITINDVNG